jgi:glycine/D-amino acid oxidase-like deaminating enzyme
MPDDVYDVIIVGGGIMGCATAYYLMKADERLRVAVVEMDPTYSQSSTTLSVANVRVQFNLKENIQISQYALEVRTSRSAARVIFSWRSRRNATRLKKGWPCKRAWAARWSGCRPTLSGSAIRFTTPRATPARPLGCRTG